ncbi:MAG TPA: MBL fold metallo-hydrolase [Rubrivivax sp.]|jgi:glyoxylase-like metal-dependent hydrolase (beta-lactamase superfamily II)|nr:MBL fold metallo-hydrolase [Rubrivivax sp.]
MAELDPRAAPPLRPRRRASAALEYPYAAPTPDGAVVEIAPGVLWARMPLPIALDHLNVWLLRGDTGWTVVDTGMCTETTRMLWERIVAEHLGGAPIEALVCTHYHYDHTGLASWFSERFDVPVYMSLAEFLMLRGMADEMAADGPPPAELQRYLDRAGMPAERSQRLVEALRSDPYMPPPLGQFRRLRAGDELTIGRRRWQVLIGEGHSPEHVCLYCAEERLLIGGDQLLPRITSNVLVTGFEPEANPIGLFFASLDRLDRCAADTLVLPAHQSAFRGLHARTQELREHHRHQFEVLRRYVAEQGEATAFQAMRALFPHLRQASEDILALGETVAHLNALRAEGSLQRRLGAGGVWRYTPAPLREEQPEVHW